MWPDGWSRIYTIKQNQETLHIETVLTHNKTITRLKPKTLKLKVGKSSTEFYSIIKILKQQLQNLFTYVFTSIFKRTVMQPMANIAIKYLALGSNWGQ